MKDGHQVVSFDNYTTGDRKNELDGVEYLEVDIRDGIREGAFFDKIQHAWVHTKEFDVIFHMAALPRIGPSFSNPKEVCDVNVSGTQNILEYAKKHKIPVVYAGSSSFWGGTHKNPYTFSKWQGEELCKLYEQIYGLDVTICRFYNVYGDYMPTEGSYRTVLPIFLEQYRNNETFTITGDGKQRRDFTHVDDIIDAMMKVVQLNKWGNVYELGRGKNYSIKQVVDMFPDPAWTYIDMIPGEARDTLCRSELARKKLKWKPKVNLEDWIKEQL